MQPLHLIKGGCIYGDTNVKIFGTKREGHFSATQPQFLGHIKMAKPKIENGLD